MLDPQWLINAATIIIRDPDIHRLDLDRRLKKKLKESYRRLYDNAELDEVLLPHLFPKSEYSEEEREQLIRLFEMFGLAVPLATASKADRPSVSASGISASRRWLIPALLVPKAFDLSSGNHWSWINDPSRTSTFVKAAQSSYTHYTEAQSTGAKKWWRQSRTTAEHWNVFAVAPFPGSKPEATVVADAATGNLAILATSTTLVPAKVPTRPAGLDPTSPTSNSFLLHFFTQCECSRAADGGFDRAACRCPSCLEPAALEEDGFLPDGIFPRLLGMLVSQVEYGHGKLEGKLHSAHASLRIGQCDFTLEHLPKLSSIKICVAAENPLHVHRFVVRAVDTIIQTIGEGLSDRLHHQILLEHGGRYVRHACLDCDSDGSASAILDSFQMPLAQVRQLSPFACWFDHRSRGKQRGYDVFISYKHGTDSGFAEKLFNCQQCAIIGPSGRRPVVYLDEKRFELGKQLRTQLLDALRRSKVVVPVISSSFLGSMKTLNGSCNWLLLECWAMIELFDLLQRDPVNADVAISRIFPIVASCSGVAVGSIFGDEEKRRCIAAMPDVVHEPTQAALIAYFQQAGLTLPETPKTVREIVQRLLEFAGVDRASDNSEHGRTIAASTLSEEEWYSDQIQEVCDDAVVSASPAPLHPQRQPTLNHPPARDHVLSSMELPMNKGYHFFICHHQGSGGDQANLLCEALRLRGFKVWYDNDQTADQRNLQGMRQGVKDSECLLLFLSGRKETEGQPDIGGEYEGPFSRWFCHEEMRAAHVHGLKVVCVMESDERKGKPDFFLEKHRALTGGNDGGPVNEHALVNVHLIADACFIPFRRQQHERQAMLDEIVRQREINLPLSCARSRTTDHAASPSSIVVTTDRSTPVSTGATGMTAGARVAPASTPVLAPVPPPPSDAHLPPAGAASPSTARERTLDVVQRDITHWKLQLIRARAICESDCAEYRNEWSAIENEEANSIAAFMYDHQNRLARSDDTDEALQPPQCDGERQVSPTHAHYYSFLEKSFQRFEAGCDACREEPTRQNAGHTCPLFAPLEAILREPGFEGVELSIGNAKKEERCLEKTREFNQLRDLRRASVVCKNVAQARRLTNRVADGAEYNCRRCKLGFSNDFDDNQSSGYRDAQLNLSCRGSDLIFELQVHLERIYDVKIGLGGGGHTNYKSFRQRKEPILRKLRALTAELDALVASDATAAEGALARVSLSTAVMTAEPVAAATAPKETAAANEATVAAEAARVAAARKADVDAAFAALKVAEQTAAAEAAKEAPAPTAEGDATAVLPAVMQDNASADPAVRFEASKRALEAQKHQLSEEEYNHIARMNATMLQEDRKHLQHGTHAPPAHRPSETPQPQPQPQPQPPEEDTYSVHSWFASFLAP